MVIVVVKYGHNSS